MGAMRTRLRRWHIWLGWLVGIPMLLWTVSGVVMVWKPIEEVRGEGLLRPLPPMRFDAPVIPPAVAGVQLHSLSLEQRAAGPRWVITLPDGHARLADPASGVLLPPLAAADAVREVTARYSGDARVRSVTRTDPLHPPLELRHAVATWRVSLDDGTNFYVDASSGMLHAKRTRWWRFYDLMWGLHIMDPGGREDTHNPWVIGFGILALATTILALAMLPLTIRRRKRSGDGR